MNDLEKNARLYAGITPDVKDVQNLYQIKTNQSEKAMMKYNAFKAGVEYQKENMWVDIEENGYPPYDENRKFEQENYLLRFVSGSISPKISYKIGYLTGKYKFIGEMDWVRVTHWMPIPKM